MQIRVPLLISLLVLNVGASATNSTKLSPRIVGGQKAIIGQFPFQVSVQWREGSKHFCGGSIISARHVITAAHCVSDASPGRLQVSAGGTLLNALRHTRPVTNIFVHEHYNPQSHENDIAVIRVAEDFPLKSSNDFLRRIPLSNVTVPDGAYCTVSGWGTTRYNYQKIPNDLLYTGVLAVNRTECNTKYSSKSVITARMVCAGMPQGGHDSCQGDSGGPLVYDQTLVGVVSFGIACALREYPGVYTDVAHFVPWIHEQTVRSFAVYDSVADIQITAMVIAVTLYATLFK